MAASSSKVVPGREHLGSLSLDLPNGGRYSSRLVDGHVCLVPPYDTGSYKMLEIRMSLEGQSIAHCMVEAVRGDEYFWVRDDIQLFQLKQSLFYEPPLKEDAAPVKLAFQFQMPPRPDKSAVSDSWRLELARNHEYQKHEVDKDGAKSFNVSAEQCLPASVSMREKERILMGYQEAIVQYSLSAMLMIQEREIFKAEQTIQYVPPVSESDLTDESDVHVKEGIAVSGTRLLPKDQQPKGFQFPFSRSKNAAPYAKFDIVLSCPKQIVMGSAYKCLLYLQNIETSPDIQGTPILYTIKNLRLKVNTEHWFRVRCKGRPNYPTNSPAVQYGLVKKWVYETGTEEGFSISKDKDNVTTLTFGPLPLSTGFSVSTFNVVRKYKAKITGAIFAHEKKVYNLDRKVDLEIIAPLGTAGSYEAPPPEEEEDDAPPRYSYTEEKPREYDNMRRSPA